MKKIKRKDRNGYLLVFDNGKMYSVVDLGEPPYDKKIAPEELQAWKTIGESYERLGGRFEAIEVFGGKIEKECLEGDCTFGEILRGNSYSDVILKVREKENET